MSCCICHKVCDPHKMELEYIFYPNMNKVYRGCSVCDSYLTVSGHIRPEVVAIKTHDCNRKGKILGWPNHGPYPVCLSCTNAGKRPAGAPNGRVDGQDAKAVKV